MQRKKLIILSISLLTASIFSNNALALGTFSRACQFAKIPVGMQTVAAAFFYALGAPSYVLDLPNKLHTANFILESITADYGRTRYFLFASRLVYTQYDSKFMGDHWIAYYKFRDRVDSQWTAESISQAMQNNPEFSPYYHNRGLLYSARAGASEIIEELGSVDGHYLVIGRHWYYDPLSKSVVTLPESRSNNCNITNMGFGTGLFNR